MRSREVSKYAASMQASHDFQLDELSKAVGPRAANVEQSLTCHDVEEPMLALYLVDVVATVLDVRDPTGYNIAWPSERYNEWVK